MIPFRPVLATLAFVCACTFFDPLSQEGLGLTLQPTDTAVYVGASFQARGLMVNSYGDRYPSDHIRYTGPDQAATVSANGRVSGETYGRARVVATRSDLIDTGWVSVVPVGTLAVTSFTDPSAVSTVNVDGSAFVTIASAGQYASGAPAWLPGNAGLVYQYGIPGGAGATELFVTDLAGNNALLAASGRDPRVSRDGAWVYFADNGAIWRVHPDGNALELLNTGGVYMPDPSPGGTQLTYVHTQFPSGAALIVVRDLSDTLERSLGVQGFLPRWGPGDSTIAYWNGNDELHGAIYVIKPDGSGGHQVSKAGRPYLARQLDWSPDGQWVLARSDSTLDLINVVDGLTLPLGYSAQYQSASWKW